MEAAFVAAKRGHHVVLCEKEAELGGLMRIAAVPIAKQDLTRLIQYMARRLEGAGVEVRLNCAVDKAMLEGEFKGWEVIAGAGAQPIVVPAFTGFKQWMTADDVLAGRAFPGRKIVVIGGGSVGCETADYLAPLVNDLYPRNREITLLEICLLYTSGTMWPPPCALKTGCARWPRESSRCPPASPSPWS